MRRWLFLLFLLPLCLLGRDPGKPVYVDREVEVSGRPVRLAFCLFHTEHFRPVVLSNRSKAGLPIKAHLAQSMEGQDYIAAVNGGFFYMQRFEPQGLVIAQGEVEGQFDPKAWMDGVFLLRDGKPQLIHCDAYKAEEGTTDVIQAGPWLVRDGKVQGGYTNDEVPRRRTYILEGEDGWWAIGIVDATTLGELAELLKGEGVTKQIVVRNCLNLDGGGSTAYWVSKGQGKGLVGRWSVVNYVAIDVVEYDF